MSYILAIDEGTTGTKAVLMDENLTLLSESTLDFEQHFPKPGWVEHDLNEIWSKVVQTIKNVTADIDPKKIDAIGITNQRETICFWDRESTQPLCRAIVWQDRRTSELCKELKSKGAEPFFQDRTGLLLDPYFSGTKVAWAFKNIPAVKDAHQNGTLAVGTIDSFLVAKLSGGGNHVTEPSNASRTLCYHLTQHKWDEELCQTLGIPVDIWPEVRPSMGIFSKTHGLKELPDGIPISGILGDQQSALLGQACVNEGNAKCTYGTGAFILLNTGNEPKKSRHRLLTTIAWAKDEREFTYALEGSAFMAGATVQWLRDGLGIIEKSSDIEKLALEVESSDGVMLVPAFAGLGAPYWNPDARGIISGLTRGTTKAHIARAALEGIALQNSDILNSMEKDLGKRLSHLNVDGGACVNDTLMQYQADVLNLRLKRPENKQTTILGAVFAAGLGVGIWDSFRAIEKAWKREKLFEPKLKDHEREEILSQWNHAIKQAGL